MRPSHTVVLQPQRTLDEVVLGAFETFYNGCNWTLSFDEEGRAWIEMGCYGYHVNLIQGDEWLLHQWFHNQIPAAQKHIRANRRFLLPVSPETVRQLQQRKPCERCGGFKYKERK